MAHKTHHHHYLIEAFWNPVKQEQQQNRTWGSDCSHKTHGCLNIKCTLTAARGDNFDRHLALSVFLIRIEWFVRSRIFGKQAGLKLN